MLSIFHSFVIIQYCTECVFIRSLISIRVYHFFFGPTHFRTGDESGHGFFVVIFYFPIRLISFFFCLSLRKTCLTFKSTTHKNLLCLVVTPKSSQRRHFDLKLPIELKSKANFGVSAPYITFNVSFVFGIWLTMGPLFEKELHCLLRS